MYDLTSIKDVVGQLPFLKSYTPLMLAFPLQDDSASRESAITSLQSAALKLTSAFPWLGAKVVNKGSCEGNSGLFELETCDMWSPPNTVLQVRDYSDLCPSYKSLVEARGPATMLDGNILSPRKAFPESYQESEADPAPVIAFQANLIEGGLLLVCAAQHNFIDMNGIDRCFNLLAAAMRDEAFPSEAIEQGNRDRQNLVPLLQPDEPAKDHSQFKRPPLSELPLPSVEPNSPFSWRYFRFSAARLTQLKALATGSEGGELTVPYISTNDALSAFCWQRVISVRLRRRRTPNAIAKFCRALDARKTMGVPQSYMGDLVTIAQSEIAFHDMADSSLPAVASLLRKDLNAVNDRDYIRSFATFIANTPDKSTIVYGGRFNPDTAIGSSSWAQIQLSGITFGALGKPGLVRRPNFGPLKSDIYFMPHTEGGDIDALLCFNDEDMKGLQVDEQWNQYADYIG